MQIQKCDAQRDPAYVWNDLYNAPDTWPCTAGVTCPSRVIGGESLITTASYGTIQVPQGDPNSYTMSWLWAANKQAAQDFDPQP